MLNGIIDFSVKNKFIIGLFISALVIYGAYEVTRLPIDAVPDITNNQVQIITVAPSLGATDIERLITFPIEQANSNINGIKELRSFSRFGLSLVTVVFDDETDLYWARQQIAERLQKIQSQIPPGIGIPEMGPVTTGLGEIYQYVVRAKKGYEKKYNEMELRTLQDWVVRRQLLGVEGVAEVSSFGGKLKQYEISINPNQLNAYQITLDELFSALEKNNQNTGGAYIEHGPSVLFIRSEGLINSTVDIENICVKTTQNGTPVKVKDVAEVQIGYSTRFGAMCYNDEGEVSGAVVMMLKGSNSSKVIANIKDKINEIQKTLPEGVIIEPFLDRTKMVNNAMSTVEINLLEGAFIVLFVLILFLGNIRSGILIATVIPLAMLFAVILMNLFGVVGNLMSLGALDFGLIVDGSVFIVEAVLHQLMHSKIIQSGNALTQSQMDTEVSGASKKMARSVVFGQLIILIVYLPTFTLQGIEGKMFIPMAQTVAFALLGAFILSITYVPMMSALILSKKIKLNKTLSDRMMNFFERHYSIALNIVLRNKKTVVTITLLLFSFAVYLVTTMGGEFIPALEEGDFAVETRLLSGSSIETSIAYTQQAAHLIKSRYPEVEKVVTKIGNSEIPTDPMPMEAADMMIILKDKSEWTSASSFPELAEKMSATLKEVPGISTGFQFPVQMRFNELMTGARQDVVCKIFGENLDSLSQLAARLGGIISTVDGTADLYIEPVTGVPQIIIQYNREVIAQHNLSIEEINRMVNISFAGQSTGLVYEGEKRFDLIVRLNESSRKKIEDINNLLIPTQSGQQIPLRHLANISVETGPNQIQREETRRRIVVGFNVRGRDVQSLVSEVKEKVEKQLPFPSGYSVKYGGTFENLNSAKKRLAIVVPIALFLIYLLLYFTFGSLKQGILIYSAIPLSAIGGIYFLALRDMPFSISAGVGFVALFGVAVLNGIVLISEFNRLRNEGITDTTAIVLEGTRIRLRPVLMTAMVASLGFLPMALSKGAGAEVQRPLATVVIGGLLISTFLTLFVLPILYIWFEKQKKISVQPGTAILLLSLGFGCLNSGYSQTISLNAAIDSAIQNNLQLKNSRLTEEYKKQLIKSAIEIQPLNFSAEYGQINSYFLDKRVGVSQQLNLPGVYLNARQLAKEEWKSSVLATRLNEAELKKSVALLYNHLKYLIEKTKLVSKYDSLSSIMSEQANLRFQKGLIDEVEKSSITLQFGEIKLQSKQLMNETELALIELQLLLNTKAKYKPEGSLSANTTLNISPNDVETHPLLAIWNQKRNESVASLRLEKSKLWPDLNAGFNTMSMIGTGSDNITYDNKIRFNSGQVSVGLPLFIGSRRSKIKSIKTGIAIAQNELNREEMELNNRMQKMITQFQNQLESLEWIKKNIIAEAKKIQEKALQKYTLGEINFTEYILLYNQVFTAELSYLNSIREINQTTIEINYLINK
jgi:heavy metal efflux system protein